MKFIKRLKYKLEHLFRLYPPYRRKSNVLTLRDIRKGIKIRDEYDLKRYQEKLIHQNHRKRGKE